LVSGSSNHAKIVAIPATAAKITKSKRMTHCTKDEAARCNAYRGCCAHQHHHGPADYIEATRPSREIRYNDDYYDLYGR
jgi:hypothetical protein